MNDQNRDKLENLKNSFLIFIKQNKRKDSYLYEEYADLSLDEILPKLKDMLYFYQSCKATYINTLITEFELDMNNPKVVEKLQKYMDMFDKVISILYY